MSFKNDYLLNVDIKRRTVIGTPTFRQGDDAKLRFRIFDNNVLFDLTGFTRAEIVHELPSGNSYIHDATLNSINEIEYTYPTKVELSEVGHVKVILSVYSGTSVVSVQPFTIFVYDSMKNENLGYLQILQSLISDVQYLEANIQQAIATTNNKIAEMNKLGTDLTNAENLRKTAETTRVSNENTRKTNETSRVNAETQRVSNENTRISNETLRVAEEFTRNANENTRKTEESKRATSESTRVSAENIRISNENTRVSDENLRKSNESTRITKENERITNESSRVSNESSRVTSENERKSNETARINAETLRNNNENTRKSEEKLRQQAYSDAKAIIDNSVSVGVFNLTTQYRKNNRILDNGSTWMAKVDTINNPLPTLSTYENTWWILEAQKGVDGSGSVSKVNNISPDINGNVKLTSVDVGAVSLQNFNAHVEDYMLHASVISPKLFSDRSSIYPLNRSTFFLTPSSDGYADWITGLGLTSTAYYIMVSTDKTSTSNGAQSVVVYTINSSTGKLYGVYYRNALNDGGWSRFERLITSSDLSDSTTSASMIQVATSNAVKKVNDALNTHISTDASTTQKGHMQVGDGLNVSNGVISANFHYDSTKTLDTPTTEFLNGETIISININANDVVQQACISLMNTLMGYSLTSMTSFRFLLRTVKRTTSIIQELLVISNSASFGGLEVMKFTRGGSFVSPYNWEDWRVNLITIAHSGNPNGSVYGMVGWLLYDYVNHKLYKKTTGTTGSTNTGWVEIGGTV